jgi:hypothetical protein
VPATKPKPDPVPTLARAPVASASPAPAPSRAATIAKRGGIAAGIAGALGALAAIFTLRGSSKDGPKDSES